jgi:branched-chain amino acid transport system permease protein/neutral amino acid transport system permease protein
MSQGATIHIGSMVFTVAQMVLIALSVVVMLLVHLLMRYTRLGKAMRATAANRDLARNCGIRTDRVITSTWLISGALCGLAGAAFGINSGSFEATSGNLFLVLLLAAVFLGGPGEPYGAMLGALIIGLATEVSASVIAADYKTVVAAVILLVILTLRPSGLMGARA